MAFAQKNLSCIGVGGDNSLHMYTTTDPDTTVETADYFLSAYSQLRVGDFILANLNTGSSRETKLYHVATSTSAGVTITFPTIT